MSAISQLKAWMRLFRAHTAILEAPMAVLGAALALGTLWDKTVLLWLGFGMLYHFVGYGMNSYVDWEKGFDKDDPEKQHHPLNTGEITPKAAKISVFGGLILLLLYGLALGNFTPLAFGCAGVMVISGVAYNYFGKYTDFKFIPISIVHTMVFVFPYVVISGIPTSNFTNADYAVVLMVGAYFIHHIFQIMISGDVKDIRQDEASLIKRMGAQANGNVLEKHIFRPGVPVLITSYILVILEISLATSAIVFFGGSVPAIVSVIVLGAWMLYEADGVVSGGPYMRDDRVDHMSRKELAGYLTIHAAAVPVLGNRSMFAVAVFMFGYLFATSKFMWGNWVRPEV